MDAVPGRRGTVHHAADDDKEPSTRQRSDGTRPRRAVDRNMGTPVLVGAGRKGNQRPALVRAAVDLGLQFGSHGIQRLLEVRIVAATVRLLQPLPG